ncbi:hypothetical protein AWC38_SpisGene21022 [Stylophora pistillata]|uniref:Uncharacterized protein n=1 Tax=Stylophora pistillata TaxID=50429 RepID=A0A2B4REI9_STYPI|nr:hypothetical protein AWC38_SpisGene21022 [Stylophora pistillata]
MSVVGCAGRGQVPVGSCVGRGPVSVGGAGCGQVSFVGGAGRGQVSVVGCAGGGPVPVVGGAGCGQVPVVGGAGRGSSGSVPAVEKQRDVVAYILNDEILSVGIVDVNRSVLRGHKIERGFVCVLVTYVKNKFVPAPVILEDPEENSCLQKGIYFSLPIVVHIFYLFASSRCEH